MALTKNQSKYRTVADNAVHYYPFDVAASTYIYRGALVSFDANGYLTNASDAATFVGKAIFRAEEEVDNSSGVDGDKQCRCLIRGTIIVKNDTTNPLDLTDLGTPAHVLDNEFVANTSVNSITFGRVVKVDAAEAEIML